MRRRRTPSRTLRLVVSTLVLVGVVTLTGEAEGAYPGANGRIAYESGVPRHIFVADADGSSPMDLGEGSNPAWSPDGTQIAFALNPDIWVMNADGSGRRPITDDPSSTHRVGEPSWSPDGTLIVFNANNEAIWMVNAAGGVQREVLDPAVPVTIGELAWSPLGDKIVFGQDDLWSISPDGGGLVNLTNTPDKYERFPDWKPDGTRIVFERGQPEEIWTMDPDGSEQVNITPPGGANAVSHPAWSPDGTKIVFTWNGIRIMNPDGSGATPPIISPGLAPDWQPVTTSPSTSTSTTSPTSSTSTTSSTTSTSTTTTSTSTTSTSSTSTSTTSTPTTSTPTTSTLPPTPACSDGLDNEGDGATDWRPTLPGLPGSILSTGSALLGIGGDPGCRSPSDTSELGTTQCDDGIDNDGDGRIDFRAGDKASVGDDQCSGPRDDDETATQVPSTTTTTTTTTPGRGLPAPVCAVIRTVEELVSTRFGPFLAAAEVLLRAVRAVIERSPILRALLAVTLSRVDAILTAITENPSFDQILRFIQRLLASCSQP
ncbi:MAG TPA: DPP IV N-terminal domain-containing protein [Acidimicrobiales bacterium]|nr:DPP IV N-terminal domain-containing protein [Acidimicrobiales bacterium]